LSDQTFTENAFSSIVEADPPFRYVHYSIISLMSHEYSPLLEKSLASLERITGKNFQYHITAARVNHAKGDTDAAIGSLQKASLLAPDFTLIYELWGDYAFSAGDYAGAIGPLEKLIQIAPPYWKKDAADNTSADAFTADQARIFKKNHPEFWRNLAMLVEAYDRTGNKNGALELMGSVSPLR
jgi:tetratricopeptide (TPR) repeat protein